MDRDCGVEAMNYAIVVVDKPILRKQRGGPEYDLIQSTVNLVKSKLIPKWRLFPETLKENRSMNAEKFEIVFENQSKSVLKYYNIDFTVAYDGKVDLDPELELEPGKSESVRSWPGQVWVIKIEIDKESLIIAIYNETHDQQVDHSIIISTDEELASTGQRQLLMSEGDLLKTERRDTQITFIESAQIKFKNSMVILKQDRLYKEKLVEKDDTVSFVGETVVYIPKDSDFVFKQQVSLTYQ